MRTQHTVTTSVTFDIATGKVLQRTAQPYDGMWALCAGDESESKDESENKDESKSALDAAALKEENERLESDIYKVRCQRDYYVGIIRQVKGVMESTDLDSALNNTIPQTIGI